MVTPNQKRVAVAHLVAEFGVSERRACLVVNQHRSTQRHYTTRSDEEQALRVRIRALAVKYPRYGYPCIHVMLLRDGFSVNRKRVQRLWRAEGLLVQRPKRRKPKVRRNPIVVRGAHPNHVWALDFQFDETADGRPVKILNVTDEFTREALATNAARRITAAGTMAVLDQIVEERGYTPRSCVWTTAQSSLPTPCRTGVEPPKSTPATATPLLPGRTDGLSRLTQDCATNS